MADDKAKTGLAVGTGALIGTAAAILFARKAEAKPPPEGEISLDEAAMNLLLAIATNSDDIDANTLETINAINRLAAALGVSVIKNPNAIAAFRVFVNVVNRAVQLPERDIPYDMELVIKAWPTNLGLMYVANSQPEATNINSSYPLIANEFVRYRIENSKQIWINASRAGESVVCTVEQRRGGTL